MLRRPADGISICGGARAESPANSKWGSWTGTLVDTLSAAGLSGRRALRGDAGGAQAGVRRGSRSASLRMRGRRTPRTPTRCATTMGAVHVGRRSSGEANGDLFAIAAPHVSPQGGWQILPRGLRHAAAGTQGPHVRDSGDLALRRAGDFRPDAQDVPHAAGRCASRHGAGRLAGGTRRQRCRAWKTTATASNTPWSCR